MPRAAAARAYAAMILADQPVGYWRLTEASGLIAADQGGVNDGVISGGVTLGQSGPLASEPSGALFNGSTGKVLLAGPPAALRLPGPLTIEVWAKLGAGSADAGLLGPTAGPSGYALTWHNGASIFFYILNGGNSLSAPLADTSLWHHIVATWDGTTGANGMKLYIDGKLAGQKASTSGALSAWTDVALGQSSTFFNGSIAEAAVYPSVLSATRVLQHYQASASILRPHVSYPTLILSDGPAAYWRLDDVGAATVDASGNANDGSFQGTVTKGVAGALADGNPALSLGAGGFVNILDSASTRPTSISVEIWTKLTAFPNNFANLIQKASSGAWTDGFGLYARMGPNKLLWWVNKYDGGGGVSAVDLNMTADGFWHHIVGTYDGLMLRLYRDGVLVASQTTVLQGSAGPITYQPSTLGLGSSVGGGGNFWGLPIDEAAIFPYALTSQQVLRHYQTGLRGKGSRTTAAYSPIVLASSPVDYWRLNDVALPAADSGSLNRPAAYAAGSIEQGLLGGGGRVGMQFDGITANLLAAGTIAMPNPGCSIEAWVNHLGQPWSGAHEMPCSMSNNRNYLSVNAGKVYSSFGIGGLQKTLVGLTNVPTTGWHHICAIFDGSTQAVYLDGVLDASAAQSGALDNPWTGTSGTSIGGFDGVQYFFKGLISDVAIYTRALTPAEIQVRARARAAAASRVQAA